MASVSKGQRQDSMVKLNRYFSTEASLIGNVSFFLGNMQVHLKYQNKTVKVHPKYALNVLDATEMSSEDIAEFVAENPEAFEIPRSRFDDDCPAEVDVEVVKREKEAADATELEKPAVVCSACDTPEQAAIVKPKATGIVRYDGKELPDADYRQFALEPILRPTLNKRGKTTLPKPGHSLRDKYISDNDDATTAQLNNILGQKCVRWTEVEGFRKIAGQYGRYWINRQGQVLSDICPGCPATHAVYLPLYSKEINGRPSYCLMSNLAVPREFLVLQTFYTERPSRLHYSLCLDGDYTNLNPYNLAWSDVVTTLKGTPHIAQTEAHNSWVTQCRRDIIAQQKQAASEQARKNKQSVLVKRCKARMAKPVVDRRLAGIPTFSTIVNDEKLDTVDIFQWDHFAERTFRSVPLPQEIDGYFASEDGLVVSKIGTKVPEGCARILRGCNKRGYGGTAVHDINTSDRLDNGRFRRISTTSGEMVLLAWGPKQPGPGKWFAKHKNDDVHNNNVNNLYWSRRTDGAKVVCKRAQVKANELEDLFARVQKSRVADGKSINEIADAEHITAATVQCILNTFATPAVDGLFHACNEELAG